MGTVASPGASVVGGASRRSPLALIALVVVPVAVGGLYAAAALAWRAGFHPALGPPIWSAEGGALVAVRVGLAAAAPVVFGLMASGRRTGAAALFLGALAAAPVGLGPVYGPDAGARWTAQAVRASGADSPDVQVAVLAASLGGLVALGLVAALTAPGPLRASGSHGTAAWDDGASLRSEDGLVLGRQKRGVGTKPGGRSTGPLLRYDGPGHVLTVAPTRAGKGVGAVVPNLLDHPGPVLVTDPKGENLTITARWRAETLGHRVVALDPFGLAPAGLFEGSHLTGSIQRGGLNPLDLVGSGGPGNSPDAPDDAALIAEMLVVDGDDGGNRFWTDEAKALLSGLVLYVARTETGDRRSLLTVREHLTAAPDDFEALLGSMAGSGDPVVRRTAHRVMQKADRERSGVVSSAQSHTHFLDSPRMANVLARSTFDPADLRADTGAGGQLSVYLLLPPDRLDAFSRWLRLTVATALAAVSRLGPLAGGAPPASGRALFLLDEFAQLGPMPPVRRAVSLMAGYGVQVWPFLQDLGQLRRLYPKDWETYVANSDVVQAFGTTDQFTAEYLSKMAGTATVFDRSTGSGRSRGKRTSRSSNVGSRETGRPLATPDELRRLAPGDQLLLIRGRQPVLACRVAFYADRAFCQRASGGRQ